MYSDSGKRSFPDPARFGADVVTSYARLRAEGTTHGEIRSHLDGRRWQRLGRAVIRHNGPPTTDELRRAALVVLGPRALLTSFTGLQMRGLEGWGRDAIHVLVPRGARVTRPDGLPLRVHYTDDWERVAARRIGTVDHAGHAALLAAASFSSVRPAAAILAATVQQRLLRPGDVVAAVCGTPRVRHRHGLLAAAHDIEQGAQALSEIDFAALCRRNLIAGPVHQAVRQDAAGRRRYLDAEFRTRSGRRLIAEVDGALHLIVQRWWDDQLRQNELTIGNDVVLRFPSVVFRDDEHLVAGQLRRGLEL